MRAGAAPRGVGSRSAFGRSRTGASRCGAYGHALRVHMRSGTRVEELPLFWAQRSPVFGALSLRRGRTDQSETETSRQGNETRKHQNKLKIPFFALSPLPLSSLSRQSDAKRDGCNNGALRRNHVRLLPTPCSRISEDGSLLRFECCKRQQYDRWQWQQYR